MKTQAKEFRVEGHGLSLRMIGGVSSHVNPFVQMPLLTRVQAWAAVKELCKDGQNYHTVKVWSHGEIVFRAFRQVDGTYIDAKTCKRVA